ncbi:cupin domain-containing protein [Acidocella sp.]|uniref:cupin domain-containing protein n=1 Tax=Acidocella sp. TaxID=50710 RepID=UPI002610B8FD|nr:AraC family ligand binding domain-containing protein [Acidocella sp.]
MTETEATKEGFKIFRKAQAPSLMQAGCMKVEPYTDVQRAGIKSIVEAGFLDGEEIRVLCNIPGFSLTHVWFKKDYPLPRHSHDADCLYYIIAGNVRLGTEELGPGDSFFVPSGVPYTYKPGDQGVELLEFRHANHFNFVTLAHGEAFWKKATETCATNREAWKTAERPLPVA